MTALAAPPVPAISRADRRERLARAPSLAPETLHRLAQQHPNAETELHYRSPFEPIQVEPYVATLGFFRMKAKSIVGLARALVERYGGEVPQTMSDLVKLPGVGRKTANVVLGVLWNKPEGVVVDTHVIRLSQRLGWTKHREPEKIELDLCAILPRPEWDHAAHVLIFHGRRVCFARKPACAACRVQDVCPAAFDAEHVGRKSLADPSKPAEAKKRSKSGATSGKKNRALTVASAKAGDKKRTKPSSKRGRV